MTKHLINYCPIDWYEDELKRKGMTLAGLVQQLGVTVLNSLFTESRELSLITRS